MEKTLNREEAISILYDVINSDIINDEIADKLQEIANLIETEGQWHIDAFGMNAKDYGKLIVSPLCSINGVIQESYKAHIKECNEIVEKYRWK